ncbi:SDR family oxidoreductase [Roseateles sp. LKC17W]|uniref:SDR family oxidoreductase n=1 Tax=Pelomonas margarita TaxID=3299031 RepID=A0ABW7FNG3_9BURK
MNVLIIGASRGLGLEFVRQYRAAGARVTATVRDDAGRARLSALGAKPLTLDVASAASVSGLAWQIDGEAFDVVIINAGVFGPRAGALEAPTQDDFDTVMRTNVLGPMRLLPQVAEALAPGARLAIVSSRMGSIGLRTGTHGWLYRASKAAVNSVMKDAALALAGRVTVISFHPGWVRTDMGGAEADIDAPTSIAGMRTVLASVKPADTGSFFNYDGQPLAW